jgi:hypothetical protein
MTVGSRGFETACYAIGYAFAVLIALECML